jgi:High-temperature-induced dauer-formation protein
LFTQATAQLCQIVETPYNIYFDQALNCVRVLTRILPFLLEKGSSIVCRGPLHNVDSCFL